MSVTERASGDRTLAAAGLILVYAMVIGFTDNYVRVIAAEAGLWQFHLTRSLMAAVLLGVAAVPLGLRLRPVRWRAVVARSAIHGIAMVIYFGALAFLDVALVAAGLFTAPIWVLLISRFVYGHAIGPVRIIAVILGFAGVVLVLGPEAMAGASLPAMLPVLAGAMYAMGNIATREWCAEESAETLLAGFFAVLGVIGAVGLVVLWVLPLPVPDGTDGFLQRGAVWPSTTFYFWTFVQAAGVAFGGGHDDPRLSDHRCVEGERAGIRDPAGLGLLDLGAVGDGLAPLAVLGMVLIVAAGSMIALRAKAVEG